MSYDNFTHGGCKVNKPAPAIPTRVQEVDAEASEIERIHNIRQHNRADAYERLARTLAALEAERDELKRRCAELWYGANHGLIHVPKDTIDYMHKLDKERWAEHSDGRDNAS